MRPLFRALLALPLAVLPAAAQQTVNPQITDVPTLVQAMHQRWSGDWYRTLSFTQATTRMVGPDSSVTEEWREWAMIPGRLRIEMGPETDQRGAIIARDSTYTVRGGVVVRRTDDWNPLMTLGFDVYRQPPATTLAQLRRLGFDTERFHADSLDGRAMYVIGAAAGDTASKQAWIEADRLLFVRMIDPQPQGPAPQIWFLNYQRAGRAWIAPEVEVRVGGRRVFHEVYSDIIVDEPMPDHLFDPDFTWLR